MTQVTQTEKIEFIEISKIKSHPEVKNIRSKINKADCKELMNSIVERGVQNPITVFRVNGDTYLVNGERRLSSLRWLSEEFPRTPGYKNIPSMVKDYGKDLKEIISNALIDNTMDNIQREDLNGYDIATRMKQFIEMGMEKQDICQKIGKSITWLNEALRFLDADPAVKDAVKKGDLSLDEGKKISKLDPEKQKIVTDGLVQAKQFGDKKSKKKIKKNLEKATRVRSAVAPTKKEITISKNKLFEITSAMKKAGEKDSKPFLVLSGIYVALQYCQGETNELGLDKYLRKYKLEVGSDGRMKKEKAKTTIIRKNEKSNKKGK